ncbi:MULTISPECIES: hypothetical protein [Enterobacteriaceae]|jgi:hypothetical protein|nr:MULTISPECIES: hypothetical protein [Enterobacteriaceae]MCR4458433.1 hypothetical protein [Pseudescherichia sp. L3]
MSSRYLDRYFVHVPALFLAEEERYQNKVAEINRFSKNWVVDQ